MGVKRQPGEAAKKAITGFEIVSKQGTVAALPKGQLDYCDARSTSSTVPDRRASPPKAAPVTPFWNLARARP